MWKLAGLGVGVLRLFDVLHTEKCVGVWLDTLIELGSGIFPDILYTNYKPSLQHIHTQTSTTKSPIHKDTQIDLHTCTYTLQIPLPNHGEWGQRSV